MDENNSITMEDMITQLGGTPPDTSTASEGDTPPATDPPAQTEPATEPGSAPPAEGGTQAPASSEGDTPAPDELMQAQRQQQAFVYMRQQNKRQQDLLKGVASILGIEKLDASNENQLMDALQAKITANQAQQQQIPVEVLQRLQTLEQQNTQYQAAQRERDMAVGFQNIKTKFGLEQKDLNAFAAELVKQGKNPMTQDIDLVREYKLMHYDDLVNKATAKAIAAEQARAAKANSQATTPSNQTGAKHSGGPDKVNSVRDLESWLKANI